MEKKDCLQKAKHLGFLEVIIDNKLEGLDFYESKVVTLEKKGLCEKDFYESVRLLSLSLKEQAKYKITDRIDYETETLLVVRKRARKSFADLMSGWGEVPRRNIEFQRVYHEDGSVDPVYTVINYFDSGGKHISTSFCAGFTKSGKKYCNENPDVVQKSPFSYVPYNEIKEELPTEFAKTLKGILNSDLK